MPRVAKEYISKFIILIQHKQQNNISTKKKEEWCPIPKKGKPGKPVVYYIIYTRYYSHALEKRAKKKKKIHDIN